MAVGGRRRAQGIRRRGRKRRSHGRTEAGNAGSVSMATATHEATIRTMTIQPITRPTPEALSSNNARTRSRSVRDRDPCVMLRALEWGRRQWSQRRRRRASWALRRIARMNGLS